MQAKPSPFPLSDTVKVWKCSSDGQKPKQLHQMILKEQLEFEIEQVIMYSCGRVCTVHKMHSRGCVVEAWVTVGHQRQIWSLPASWLLSSPWQMFSDDNIWPLWLSLVDLSTNYCCMFSFGPISCSLTPLLYTTDSSSLSCFRHLSVMLNSALAIRLISTW